MNSTTKYISRLEWLQKMNARRAKADPIFRTDEKALEEAIRCLKREERRRAFWRGIKVNILYPFIASAVIVGIFFATMIWQAG